MILVRIPLTLRLPIRLTKLAKVVLGSVLGREHSRTLLWKVTSAGTDETRVRVVRVRLVLALIPLKMTLGRSLDVPLKIGVNTWYGLYYVV